MKIYAVAYYMGYDGWTYENEMYTSKEEAERKCKELNKEEMEDYEVSSYKDFIKNYDHYEIRAFELK